MGFINNKPKIDLPRAFAIPVGDGEEVEAIRADGSTRYEVYDGGKAIAKLSQEQAARALEYAGEDKFSKVRGIVYNPFNF